jgi:hypothetical protein
MVSGIWERNRAPDKPMNKLNVASLIVVCIIVFVVSLYGVDQFFAGIHPDFLKGYHPGALSIRESGEYLNLAGKFNSHWPPGYSVFISPIVVACWLASSTTAALFHYLAPVMPLAMIAIAWHASDWYKVRVGKST